MARAGKRKHRAFEVLYLSIIAGLDRTIAVRITYFKVDNSGRMGAL